MGDCCRETPGLMPGRPGHLHGPIAGSAMGLRDTGLGCGWTALSRVTGGSTARGSGERAAWGASPQSRPRALHTWAEGPRSGGVRETLTRACSRAGLQPAQSGG